ncbi:hypothetical protein AAVH_12271 [Aphelenchoides avenae]|nr:hypothetical protein AAVH_12271 [Aphelenchus avenae]
MNFIRKFLFRIRRAKLRRRVLLEAFHFLPRDELERCGQVCHKWRELIERSQGSLPLRFVEVRTVSLRGIVDKWPKIPCPSRNEKNHYCDLDLLDDLHARIRRSLYKNIAKEARKCFFRELRFDGPFSREVFVALRGTPLIHTEHLEVNTRSRQPIGWFLRSLRGHFVTKFLQLRMDNKPYLLTRSVQGLLVAKHANPQVELTIVGKPSRDSVWQVFGNRKCFRTPTSVDPLIRPAEIIENYTSCESPQLSALRSLTIRLDCSYYKIRHHFEQCVRSCQSHNFAEFVADVGLCDSYMFRHPTEGRMLIIRVVFAPSPVHMRRNPLGYREHVKEVHCIAFSRKRSSLPLEVFADALRWLPRFEVDKLQLASRGMCQLAESCKSILPLHHIWLLSVGLFGVFLYYSTAFSDGPLKHSDVRVFDGLRKRIRRSDLVHHLRNAFVKELELRPAENEQQLEIFQRCSEALMTPLRKRLSLLELETTVLEALESPPLVTAYRLRH